MTNTNTLDGMDIGFEFTPVEYPEEILALTGGDKAPGGVILATGAQATDVRPGSFLARLSATVTGVGLSGQYIVCKSTQVKTQFNESASAQDIELDDVSMFAVGDLLKVGDHDASAIISINLAANTVNVIVGTNGTSPIVVDTRASVPASGQEDAVGIAATRYTQKTTRVTRAVGRTSMYIAGTFKKAALYGYNSDMDADLGGYDVVLAQETAYRIP